MTREELKSYILNTYDIDSDSPWARDPESEVFRHLENKKWFVLLTNAPVSALAPSTPSPIKYKNTQPKSEQTITVINVKVDPVLSGSLRTEPGIYPAYHMNKDKWITVDISVVPDDTIKWLVDMSFSATAPKAKKVPKEKKPKKDKRHYPEFFFMALCEEESSDTEFADFLIEMLIPEEDNGYDEQFITKRKEIHDILVEYYKNRKTFAQVGEMFGRSSERMSQLKDLGLRIIRSKLFRHTTWNGSNHCPLTFSEYNEHLEQRKIADKLEEEKRREDLKREEAAEARRQYEIEHSPLSSSDEIEKISGLNLGLHVYDSLNEYDIKTAGEFLALSQDEKIPGIGNKGWAQIIDAQANIRERLTDTPSSTQLTLIERKKKERQKKIVLKMERRGQPRRYPEDFFLAVFKKESSDTEFADFLIEKILSDDDKIWWDNHKCKDKQIVHDVIVDFYKKSLSISELVKKYGLTTSIINNRKNTGESVIRGITFWTINSEPALQSTYPPKPVPYPSTLSEYKMLVEKRKVNEELAIEKMKQEEEKFNQELSKYYDDFYHGPLSPSDKLSRIFLLSPYSLISRSLNKYGVETIGQLVALTGEEKLQKIGKKRWAEIKEAQAEARERLVNEEE